MSPATTVSVSWHGARFVLNLAAIREGITRRELGGLTLDSFAKSAGISRMSLWRLMDGQQVNLRTLGRVLKALELDHATVLRSA